MHVQVWTALNADYIEKQAAKQAASDAAQEVRRPVAMLTAACNSRLAWFACLSGRVAPTRCSAALTLQVLLSGGNASAPPAAQESSKITLNPAFVGLQREAEQEATRQAAEKAHSRRGASASGEGADAAEDEEEDGAERSLNKVRSLPGWGYVHPQSVLLTGCPHGSCQLLCAEVRGLPRRAR